MSAELCQSSPRANVDMIHVTTRTRGFLSFSMPSKESLGALACAESFVVYEISIISLGLSVSNA